MAYVFLICLGKCFVRVWRALGGLGCDSKPLFLRIKNQRFVLLLWTIFTFFVVLNVVYGWGWSVAGVVVGLWVHEGVMCVVFMSGDVFVCDVYILCVVGRCVL